MRLRALFPFLTVPGLFLACSSGGGGSVSSGGGGPLTSVPGSKQISSLSDSEKRQFCTDVANWATHVVPGSNKPKCATQAYTSTSNTTDGAARRAACQQAYQQCLAEPSKNETFTSKDIDECVASPDLASCNATVGDLSSCYEAAGQILTSSYETYDSYCSSIQDDGGVKLPTPPTKATVPASCNKVQQTCPALFGKSQTDTGSGSGL
jgi:hypothetical protein